MLFSIILILYASVYAQDTRLERLRSEDPEGQEIALHELRKLGKLTQVESEALVELVIEGNRVALETLRVFRSKFTVSDLKKALSDSDPNVRRSAASALGELGEHAKGAVSGLKKALSESDCYTRRNGAHALKNIDEPLESLPVSGLVCLGTANYYNQVFFVLLTTALKYVRCTYEN